jgi:YegS C-terminal NAD kinase beta sandwich-like domain
VIKPGEEWGGPTSAAPDLEVTGGDADLAAALSTRAGDSLRPGDSLNDSSTRVGILVRFRPDASSDFAGAVGLDRDRHDALGVELPVDLLRLDDGRVAVNMIVIGPPPDALRPLTRRFGANVRVDGRSVFHGPCTTIVIATGQFLRGLDVVPRGHPGDGRAEAQVYAVPARERRALRARLATGTHVPHPKITQRAGARVRVSVDRRVALEIDGRPAPSTDLVDVTVVPDAYRLLL